MQEIGFQSHLRMFGEQEFKKSTQMQVDMVMDRTLVFGVFGRQKSKIGSLQSRKWKL
jgi:hypothetical protein